MFFQIRRSIIDMSRLAIAPLELVNLSRANFSRLTGGPSIISQSHQYHLMNNNQTISQIQPNKNLSYCTTNQIYPHHQCNANCCHSLNIKKRFMAYDSSNKTHEKIHKLLSDSKKDIFVFMKGKPDNPLCGYSGIVVQILDAYGVEYDSADVMEDPEMRNEIKKYSDWPTIPQVYVDRNFVGGCDILLEMHQSGELKKVFKLEDAKDTTSSSSSSSSTTTTTTTTSGNESKTNSTTTTTK